MVIDHQTQALLAAVLARESRTLLMYIGDAYPWTTSEGEAALARLQQLIRTERSAIIALGRWLSRRRIPIPPLPAYPAGFTSYNFLALDSLLPRLIHAQEESIATREKALHSLTSAEARTEGEKVLAVKRQTLAGLRALEAAGAATASAAPAVEPTGSGTTTRRLRPGSSYEIPYRCLVPLAVDDLLVAGRVHERQQQRGAVR